MKASSSHPSRFTRLAEACLALLLLLGCLVLASAPTWMLAPTVGLASLACVLVAWGAREEGRMLRPPLFAALLLLSLFIIGLQLIPLPLELLRALSPRAAEGVDAVLVPLGLATTRPLSLDPPATWRALAGALTALLVFVTASHLVRREGARWRLGVGVALLAAALPLLSGLHWIAGTERLFGLYAFQVVPPALITPFGNPNHLAGFLVLGALLALGAARSSRARVRLRVVLWVAWGVASAGVLASGSLGGVLAWLVAHLTFIVLVLQHGARASSGRPRIGGLGGAVGLLLGIGLVFALGLSAIRPLEKELLETASVEGLGQSKLELLPGFARLALEFPWVGVGRGAFEAAWPRFAESARSETFTHPENAPLQWATELGLPVAILLLLGVLVTAGWLLTRRRLQSLQVGAVAGLVGLGLQNFVDFSLELPFVANAALVALAIAWASSTSPTSSSAPIGHREREGYAPARTALLAGLFGVLGLVATLGPGRSTLESSTDALRAAIAADRPAGEIRAVGLNFIHRHPADWTPHALMAEWAASRGASPGEALGYVQRALILHPHHGPSHRAAARALLRLGARDQAFLEYRLAARARDGGAVDEALSLARTTEERVSLTPDPDRARSIARTLTEPTAALAYLQLVPFRFPDATPLQLARLALDEARLHLRERDLPRAAEAGMRASRLAPDALETGLGRAQLLRAMGDQEGSNALLQTLWARHPGTEVGFAMVEGALARKAPRAAHAALQQTRPFLASFDERARWLELEAQLYEREGAFHRAVTSRRSACRLTPTPACWFRLARAFERMDDPLQAREAVRTGARQGPQPPPASTRTWLETLDRKVETQEASRRGGSKPEPGSHGTEALLRRLGAR